MRAEAGMDLSSHASMAMVQQTYAPHLLSLPREIRRAIWREMLTLINKQRKVDWFKKPAIEFGALSSTCRQLHREIEEFQPQYLIPFLQFNKFIYELAVNRFVPVKMQRYNSLTIQFRHDASHNQFDMLSRALNVCRNNVEELHLSFTGPDKYGTPTYLHGCAYGPEPKLERSLPADGQNIGKMVPVLWVLMRMAKLRILTLSNLNIQLFQAVFRQKPRLHYVHLTADPRSAVHLNFNINTLGVLLIPPAEYFPPVKVMHIDGNSMLHAFAFPSNCARTLEHLTWTIPEATFDGTTFGINLYTNTRQLIDNLVLNADKLATLRICVKGDGLYGRVQQYRDLERALTGSLRQLRSLKNLEIHVVKKSSNLGHSILSNLPLTVERLYLNERLVSPRELHNYICERYISGTFGQLRSKTTDPVERRLERWKPQPPLPLPNKDSYAESCQEINCDHCEQLHIWVDPVTLGVDYHGDDGKLPGGLMVERRWCDRQRRYPWAQMPGIVGEDLSRRDYIPAVVGSLKFVSYEFPNPEYICRTGGVGETVTQMVLRLNGRLIDRARNSFRLYWPQAGIIPSSNTKIEEVQHPGIQYLLAQLEEIEVQNPRDHKSALAELMSSEFTDDPEYFGNEDRAFWLFQREAAAKPETRQPPNYPYFVDHNGENDDQCH